MDTLTTPPAEEPLPVETAIPERVLAASPTATEEPTISALAEEPVPQSIAKGAEAPDLTNLILGLPEEQQRGKILETQPMEQSETSRLPSTRMYIMVASALIAILTGAGAIVVKRH